MEYIEAFPPIMSLGRARLQALANEWLSSPVARECGVTYVVISQDASAIYDVGLEVARGTKPGELVHFPADHFLRYVIDQEFSGEIHARLHAALIALRQHVGQAVFQRYHTTVGVE